MHEVRPIGIEDVNVAKCRLRLFDLVMTDETIDAAVQGIVCSLRGMGKCKNRPNARNRTGDSSDPLETIHPLAVGAWIERHRTSFEVYAYAQHLARQALLAANSAVPGTERTQKTWRCESI